MQDQILNIIKYAEILNRTRQKLYRIPSDLKSTTLYILSHC